MVETIFNYFPHLDEKQKNQMAQLQELYTEWNSKINVISRKDIESLYIHHVLHSLALAKTVDFKPINQVLDVGTGGGFPGIPLAILFPQIQFHLIDSIGKKITVVNEVTNALGLTNVTAEQIRAENIKNKYDMVVCRAVTRLKEFYQWMILAKINKTKLACLKGGDLHDEINEFKSFFPNKTIELFNISDNFNHEFFETKKVIVVS